MSVTLGYEKLFDREFYSCRIGVAKPNPAFFARILEDTGLRAASVLFIDDRAENVLGAQSIGIHAFQFEQSEGVEALLEKMASHGVKSPFA